MRLCVSVCEQAEAATSKTEPAVQCRDQTATAGSQGRKDATGLKGALAVGHPGKRMEPGRRLGTRPGEEAGGRVGREPNCPGLGEVT